MKRQNVVKPRAKSKTRTGCKPSPAHRTKKISISVDKEVLAEAQAHAKAEGKPLSVYVTNALEAKTRRGHLRRLVEEYETENGPLTREEKAAADAELRAAFGLPTITR